MSAAHGGKNGASRDRAGLLHKLHRRDASSTDDAAQGGLGASTGGVGTDAPRNAAGTHTTAGVLRIDVIEARDLAAKDRRGTSDPFVVVDVGRDLSYKTPVKPRTLNPTWHASFTVPVTPLMLDLSIRASVWDKDFIGKDFLGQIVIPIASLLQLCGSLHYDDPDNVSFWQPLARRSSDDVVSGSVHFKIGFVPPICSDLLSLLDPEHCDSTAINASLLSLDEIPDDVYFNHMVPVKHADFAKTMHDRPSQLAATTTTVAASVTSATSGTSDVDQLTTADSTSRGGLGPGQQQSLSARPVSPATQSTGGNGTTTTATTAAGVIGAAGGSEAGNTALGDDDDSAVVASGTTMIQGDGVSSGVGNKASAEDDEDEDEDEEDEDDDDSSGEADEYYDQSNEAPDSRLDHRNFFGLLTIDIVGAYNLPYENNVTRTSFDCDPFVVISFGKKTFRTRSIRHTLQPVWNERVFLHIKELEIQGNYNLTFSLYDYDRFSNNDYIGTADLKLMDVIKELQDNDQPVTAGLLTPLTRIEKILPMKLRAKSQKAGKETSLKIRYSFIRYKLLRRNFWLTLLKSFDSSSVSKINKVELTALLDSIGSTFSEESINYMFMLVGKTPDQSLTYEEAVDSLETAISGDLVHNMSLPRPKKVWNKIKKVTSVNYTGHLAHSSANSNAIGTPSNLKNSATSIAIPGSIAGSTSSPDFNVVSSPTPQNGGGGGAPPSSLEEPSRTSLSSERVTYSLGEESAETCDSKSANGGDSSESKAGYQDSGPPNSNSLAFTQREHVISIRVCPICKKRIKRKGDLDVVSHVALCAHEDLGRIDNFVLGGFLTEAYASRKWYSKIVSYVTYGGYRIGKNNGNIIVQDSETGQLIEERMPSYVRLGIRLLYQMTGGRDAIQTRKIKALLKSMSVKQGRKFDDPSSRKSIKNFITFHNLNVDEIAEPLSSFKTFNEFFYRKLKPDARPIAGQNDPTVMVSAADCRFSCFPSIAAAKVLWIKGREFTVENLLQDKELAAKFVNAPISIFRLAPQDYHRFHSPLDCKVISIKRIEGEYYTVNPMAIRTTVDVYTDNVRCVLQLENNDIGTFAMVCVGAMMVGSILITVKEGDVIRKGEEIGYFAFGGSTVLSLFPPNSVEFERLWEENSKQNLETLIRMGSKIATVGKDLKRPMVGSLSSLSTQTTQLVSSSGMAATTSAAIAISSSSSTSSSSPPPPPPPAIAPPS